MREIKLKFIVKDNQGNTHISKSYFWDKDKGIPSEETILEDMEECSCILSESNPSCDGSCINFDEGEVIEIIRYTGLLDKNRNEIYEGDIIKVFDWGIHTKDKVIHVTDIIWSMQEASWDYGRFFDIDDDGKWRILEVIGNIYQNPELLKGGE